MSMSSIKSENLLRSIMSFASLFSTGTWQLYSKYLLSLCLCASSWSNSSSSSQFRAKSCTVKPYLTLAVGGGALNNLSYACPIALYFLRGSKDSSLTRGLRLSSCLKPLLTPIQDLRSQCSKNGHIPLTEGFLQRKLDLPDLLHRKITCKLFVSFVVAMESLLRKPFSMHIRFNLKIN